MMYPHTITIFNAVVDRGVKTYIKHEIKGVLYQDKQGVRTGTTEHFTDNQGYVQIPYSAIKDYKSYDKWKLLQDKTNHWTLNENDFILKGTTDKTNPNDLDKRTIVSYENIDYAISIPNHLGVTLK